MLAEWAIDGEGLGKAASVEIAVMAGCQEEPYEALLDCVRTIDPYNISKAYKIYSVSSEVHKKSYIS